MALVLALREGELLLVGEHKFAVTRVRGPMDFYLEDQHDFRSFHVTNAMSHEILPDVFVSAGQNTYHNMVKATVDAPRSIKILRGDNFQDEPR